MDVPKLYVSPELREFSDKKSLDKRLSAVDDATLVRPPASCHEVLLGADGRTLEGGYRYTVNAFDTVARTLAPGLCALVPNLAGENQRARRKKEQQAFPEAVSVFNAVTRARFESELAQCQFVFNEADKIIEGVLGPKTKYLDNSLFFQLVDETLVATFGNEVSFYCAHVAGRRFLLRYHKNDSLCSIQSGDESHHIHRGYHFSNSESGDASVRAAPMYINPETGHACLGRFAKAKTRMIHAGREFRARLNSLLSAAMVAGGDDEAVGVELQSLRTRPLNLRMPSHEDFDDGLTKLASVCAKYGTITNSFAQSIVHHAVYTGAFPSGDSQYRALRDSQIVQRNEYDVYCAVIAEASKLPIRQRESAEQAAFDYLLDGNR